MVGVIRTLGRHAHQRLGKLSECLSDTIRTQRTLFGQYGRTPRLTGLTQFGLQRQLRKQRHIIAETACQLFGYAYASSFSEDTQFLASRTFIGTCNATKPERTAMSEADG